MKQPLFAQLLSTLLLLLIISCKQDKQVITNENISVQAYLADKQFQPESAILLKDNDLAFASKIDIIRNAKQQLKLNYYIFHPDESTAFMVKEILKKISTNKDFRVKILTDYQYNYTQLDFFKWLENQQPHGIQQIEIGLYNRPTINIIKLAEFLTMGCSSDNTKTNSEGLPECAEEKLAYLEKFDVMSLSEAENAMSIPAKIFLTGLYAHHPATLLYGIQGGYQRSVKSMQLADAAKKNKSQIEQVKELGSRYLAAKQSKGVKKIAAKLAVGTKVAGLFLNKQLGPLINSAKTIFPFSVDGVDDLPLMKHPDLEYITDYTHHKFILGDDASLQIGGRNVANAYHMHPTHLEKYYTFMDTDVHMALTEKDGERFNAAFDRIWNFRTMVASVDDVAKHAPLNYLNLVNDIDTLKAKDCNTILDATQKEACLKQLFSELVEVAVMPYTAAKQAAWDEKYKDLLATYDNYLATKKEFKSWTVPEQIFDSKNGFVQADNITAPLHSFTHYPIAAKDFYYVENLPFSQVNNTAPQTRSFGSTYDHEVTHGKGIHKVWRAALQNACEQSNQTGEPTEVIIHQGYFAPPMGITHEMNRLIKANECPNVTVKLYTNSILSTDLIPINLIGRRMLFSMNQHNKDMKSDKFQYFEYNVDTLSNIVAHKYSYAGDPEGRLKSYFSLHTKVMIFGNDIYIGSANTDFRSYLMDTNNGVFIKNAPELVARYKAFLKELATNKIVAPAKDFYQYDSRSALIAHEKATMPTLMERLALKNDTIPLSDAQQKQIDALLMILNKSSDEFDKLLKEDGKMTQDPLIDRLLKMI